MLEKHIKGFLQYCKASGFRPRSLQTLSIRLNDFNRFLKANRISHARSKITHRTPERICCKFQDPIHPYKKVKNLVPETIFPLFEAWATLYGKIWQ